MSLEQSCSQAATIGWLEHLLRQRDGSMDLVNKSSDFNSFEKSDHNPQKPAGLRTYRGPAANV